MQMCLLRVPTRILNASEMAIGELPEGESNAGIRAPHASTIVEATYRVVPKGDGEGVYGM